jgi:hypothetical protein
MSKYGFVISPPSFGLRGDLEQVRYLASVVTDVERRIVGEAGADRVGGGADRQRHDRGVEIGPSNAGAGWRRRPTGAADLRPLQK